MMQASQHMVESNRGPALRRGKQLPAIRTTFDSEPTNTRPHRPRPTGTTVHYEKWSDRVPLTPRSPPRSPPSRRRISKGGLLGLFHRTKSTKGTKASKPMEITQEEQFKSNRSLTTTSAPIVKVSSPAVKEVLSTRWQPTIPKPQPPLVDVAAKSKSLKKHVSVRSLEMWDLPPLFQAYPQAVKHATLQAPTVSADVILRMGRHKQGVTLQGVFPSTVADDFDELQYETGQQKGESLRKNKMRASSSTSRAEWTTKIFVLTTSGFMLQYAGEGNHDRLPEKTLQLGKDSAAFASDAIPGRLFVLQVSQVLNESGTIIKMPSMSVLSKIGLRSDIRLSVTNFLIVLSDAEEMNSWLVAVRREIAALGGRQYRPDATIRKPTDEVVQQLQTKTSQRYLIQRDPNQFSRVLNASTFPSGTGSNEVTVIEHNPNAKRATETVSLNSTRRQSFAPRISNDASSTTYTSSSTDQAQLDKLRESLRLSYASTGAKSFATSFESSPLPSPSHMRFTFDDSHVPNSSIRPPTSIDRSRRKSFQTLSSSASTQVRSPEQNSSPKSPRPHSINGSNLHGHSPHRPNFSVPSFSRRYSSSGPGQLVPIRAAEPRHKTPSPNRGRTESNSSNRPDSIIGDLPFSVHASPRTLRPRTSPNGSGGPSKILGAADVLIKKSDVSPISSDADPHVPRRYSSLEYSQGKLPYNFPQHAPSPHPAPQTALPAIPLFNSLSLSSLHQNQISGPPSTHAIAVPKLRRPASMQVRAVMHGDHFSLPTGRSVSSVAPPASKLGRSTIPSGSIILPKQSKQNQSHHQHTTLNRKNFSQLSPQGPPPPMPLPAIPTASGNNNADTSSSRWPEYSMATRRSLQGVRVS